MSTESAGQKRKSKLTKEAAEAISKLLHNPAFWGALTDELHPVALGNISRRTWPGGRKPLPDQIVADAIYAVVNGVRSWNPNDGRRGTIQERYPAWTPEMCSLYDKCCQVIWSLVSEEYRKSKRFQYVVSDDESVEEFPGEANVYATTEIWSDTPLEALISEENWNDFLRLLPSDDGDENQLLRRLVEEIAFSYPERERPGTGNRPMKEGWANRELAVKLSVPESAIVNAKRRLDRILGDWLWERFLEALPDDDRPWQALVGAAQSAGLPDDWKKNFAGKHSLSLGQVVAMGMELIELLHDWLKRTIRDAGALHKQINKIEQNILTSE